MRLAARCPNMENVMRKLILILTGLALATPALAQQTASFINGTHTFAPGACDKLKALAAGGIQAVSTVPWYVDEDGISYWEGGCSFSKISKGKGRNEWKMVARCSENADVETTETYTWRRISSTRFMVTLTTPGTSAADRKPVRYTRCAVGEIPSPQ
jgi:hypothetical protein